MTSTAGRTDWYARRDELCPEQIFTTQDGLIVKLDRTVPGDGTKWYVASYWVGSWCYDDGTIEPGDLSERFDDEIAASAYLAAAQTTGAA